MTVGGISIFSKITTTGMSLWIKKEGKRGKILTLKKHLCYLAYAELITWIGSSLYSFVDVSSKKAYSTLAISLVKL